jgi:hypothetical protein
MNADGGAFRVEDRCLKSNLCSRVCAQHHAAGSRATESQRGGNRSRSGLGNWPHLI